MANNFTGFNLIVLISVLVFSLLIISQNEYTQPSGNFSPPIPPQINIPAIAANEKIHIYGSGKVAKLDSSGITYVHSDYLGSASLETDASRNIVATNTYYPFGAELTKTGTGKYTFTGKELDKTELQYFGARYYDQDTGRFAQIDPVGPGYAYANNNPLRFVDPDGKQIRKIYPMIIKEVGSPTPPKYNPLSLNEIDSIAREMSPDRQFVAAIYALNFLVHVPDHLIDPVKGSDGPLYADVRSVIALDAWQDYIHEKTGFTVYFLGESGGYSGAFRTDEDQQIALGENSKAAKVTRSNHGIVFNPALLDSLKTVGEITPSTTNLINKELLRMQPAVDFRFVPDEGHPNPYRLTDVFALLELAGFEREGKTSFPQDNSHYTGFRHFITRNNPDASLDFQYHENKP